MILLEQDIVEISILYLYRKLSNCYWGYLLNIKSESNNVLFTYVKPVNIYLNLISDEIYFQNRTD